MGRVTVLVISHMNSTLREDNKQPIESMPLAPKQKRHSTNKQMNYKLTRAATLLYVLSISVSKVYSAVSEFIRNTLISRQ